MPEQDPKLRLDQPVLLVEGDKQHQAWLRCWTNAYDRSDGYRLELTMGPETEPVVATGPDAFEALVRVRRQIEPRGLRIAVQGSRLDTYPSGMARDMGGGWRIYVMRQGQGAGFADLVDTFDEAPVDQLATVEEQEAYWEAWLNQRAAPPNVHDGL
ncbi:hypothetical protein [Amycolatopsis sp. Poz14]|uniref:hypothetical protein n=1 Tax=Amycolatopsis sp. Poz14 TaxID=1447705 RepID=UPI001EE89C5D|nr:hypothetical protein [Amycolatopsis sp. Poz14]MCG3749681.1 hypothetical protein [Amycolatopsis sp. Poz14]